MKAGTNMKPALKTLCVFVLLTITIAMTSAGNIRVSVTMGYNAVLACTLKPNMTLVTWKISPKVGGNCSLSYLPGENRTGRTNCSDNMNWKFSRDVDAALEIRQVGMAQEGNYTCEIASTDGNFHKTYNLTVLVPPRMRLYCDDQGNSVCQAVAGKPAAQVSWVLGSNSHPEEEGHDNGTVTVLSRFTACGTNVTNTTCMVFHPAGDWSESISCCPSKGINFNLYICIILCLLSIMTFMAVIYYFKLRRNRLCHRTKSPQTDSVQSDTMEVEPYTTYVQKENVIYNSVSDLTAGHNLPQELRPET